jgi:hypothetical protein
LSSAEEVVSYTWRDAGLHSRLLRGLNGIGSGARALGFDWPGLGPQSLLDAATRSAGLDDFGDNSHLEGLDVLCASAQDEARLSTFGRVMLRGLILRSLSGRLKLVDWAKRHPVVRDERIERPWVVVGMPRTGTTLLSLLLGLDPTVRPLQQWEATSPVPPPDLATHAEDPRIAVEARQMDQIQNLNPPLRAMHPFGATLATECVALFLFDLRSMAIETQAFIPSYGHWLENADMKSAYALHRLALQTLQSRIPTETWSLKTPHHLWCLDTLHDSYPDARVVWTHRDPLKVLPSLASLNTAMLRTGSRNVDPVAVGADWRHKLDVAVARGMEYDERQSGASWCHHLQYAELMADPVAAMRGLYAAFGEEIQPLHERRIRAWLRDRGQNAFGRHAYDPADFGFEPGEIHERYASYRERFDVPIEE